MAIDIWGRESQDAFFISQDAGAQTNPVVAADHAGAEYAVAYISGNRVQIAIYDEQGLLVPGMPGGAIDDGVGFNI